MKAKYEDKDIIIPVYGADNEGYEGCLNSSDMVKRDAVSDSFINRIKTHLNAGLVLQPGMYIIFDFSVDEASLLRGMLFTLDSNGEVKAGAHTTGTTGLLTSWPPKRKR